MDEQHDGQAGVEDVSYVERWINGPPKGEYELRGDDGSVMISCRVDYDRDRSVWVARGELLTPDQVSNALGYSWRQGLVERVNRGAYKMKEGAS